MLVIVPRRRAADGSRVLGLPKGHIDPGETPLQAAVREVREETGVEAELVGSSARCATGTGATAAPCPSRSSSTCCATSRGDTADHDEEVEEARWMPLAQACAELTYEGEREMAGRALAALDP